MKPWIRTQTTMIAWLSTGSGSNSAESGYLIVSPVIKSHVAKV